MSAHAPGPWTVTHWGINAAARAIVFDGTMFPEDAWLIAAAPDLYDAIRNSDDAHWTPAMRAAMRKATGAS